MEVICNIVLKPLLCPLQTIKVWGEMGSNQEAGLPTGNCRNWLLNRGSYTEAEIKLQLSCFCCLCKI